MPEEIIKREEGRWGLERVVIFKFNAKRLTAYIKFSALDKVVHAIKTDMMITSNDKIRFLLLDKVDKIV